LIPDAQAPFAWTVLPGCDGLSAYSYLLMATVNAHMRTDPGRANEVIVLMLEWTAKHHP